MKHRHGLWIALVMAVVMIAASGCALLPARADAAEQERDAILRGIALVDSVEPLILESMPVQVQTVVRGHLPDDCTTLDEVSVTREGRTLKVKLSTIRPARGLCTEAREPFERTIPLDVEGLAAGTYTVSVNGVSASFELPADLIGEALWCEAPQRDGEVVYTDARAGYCLSYPANFELIAPMVDVVVIHGPDYSGGGPQPLSGFVNIQAWQAAEGRTLEESAESLYAAFGDGESIEGVERTDRILGGVPAVEFTDVPGLYKSRHVVAVQNDRVVHLIFGPSGEAYAQANADMLALYDIVMGSFTFIP